VIAGGKFENGAVTAAYGYLFNFLLSKEANINKGGLIKDTNFSMDFDNSFQIDMHDVPWGLNKLPVFKQIHQLLTAEDVRTTIACSVADACWGTRNLPPETKEIARKLDIDASKVANEVIKQNPGWSLTNLTRHQTTVVLDAVINRVPDFAKHYGNTQQIMN
jgi:hypothetical protein